MFKMIAEKLSNHFYGEIVKEFPGVVLKESPHETESITFVVRDTNKGRKIIMRLKEKERHETEYEHVYIDELPVDALHALVGELKSFVDGGGMKETRAVVGSSNGEVMSQKL